MRAVSNVLAVVLVAMVAISTGIFLYLYVAGWSSSAERVHAIAVDGYLYSRAAVNVKNLGTVAVTEVRVEVGDFPPLLAGGPGWSLPEGRSASLSGPVGYVACDGTGDYIKIPLTVYGWQGITVERLVRLPRTKPNSLWSKSFMIGDPWIDKPAFYHAYPASESVGAVRVTFTTRRPDGTKGEYSWAVTELGEWVHIVDTFDLATRRYVAYLNGEEVYEAEIPEGEYTILEWDPAAATAPSRYSAFVIGASVLLSDWVNEDVAYVRIYDRFFTEEEVLRNYYSSSSPAPDGLVVWVDFRTGNARDLSPPPQGVTVVGAEFRSPVPGEEYRLLAVARFADGSALARSVKLVAG